MLKQSVLALATLTSVVLAAAAPVVPAKGSLKLDFTVLRGSSKRDLAPHRQGGIEKRADADGSALLQLTNEQSYYSCDLYLGSSEQKSTVLVDTGSSDLWIMDTDVDCVSTSLSSFKRDWTSLFRVIDPEALAKEKSKLDARFVDEMLEQPEARDCIGDFCMSDVIIETIQPGGFFSEPDSFVTATATTATGSSENTGDSGNASGNSCTSEGSFETKDSDSFHLNSTAPTFSILYGDGTSAQGFWGTDKVKFNNHTVSDVSFAVVNETDSTFGVLGIGLAGLETTYSLGSSDAYTYENFPLRLVSEGTINKNLYSLYLNEASSLTGSVLFGAVDHAKYSGTLQTVPVINIYPNYYQKPIRLDVVLDSIKLEDLSSNVTVSTTSIAALLDSGTTFTYLPSSILSSFTKSLSATYVSSYGMYLVSCDYNKDSLYAIFDFSGVEIKVPLSDMIVKYRTSCYLGVLEQTSSSSSLSVLYAILGDNFLRNAYIVYDLEDYEISLAQANYTDDEDIEVVTLSVPLAVKAAGYSSTAINSSGSISGSTETLNSSGSKKNDGHKSRSISWPAIFGLAGLSVFALL